jgi:hypothetical protein
VNPFFPLLPHFQFQQTKNADEAVRSKLHHNPLTRTHHRVHGILDFNTTKPTTSCPTMKVPLLWVKFVLKKNKINGKSPIHIKSWKKSPT